MHVPDRPIMKTSSGISYCKRKRVEIQPQQSPAAGRLEYGHTGVGVGVTISIQRSERTQTLCFVWVPHMIWSPNLWGDLRPPADSYSRPCSSASSHHLGVLGGRCGQQTPLWPGCQTVNRYQTKGLHVGKNVTIWTATRTKGDKSGSCF